LERKSNQERKLGVYEKMKEKFYQIIFSVSIFINIIFIMTILLFIIGNNYSEDFKRCDYDSCSQEVYKWNINGSVCFDNNASECQDFLRLWRVCQEYKNKIGVC